MRHSPWRHENSGAIAVCILAVAGMGVSMAARPSLRAHTVRPARPRVRAAWLARVVANPMAVMVDERTGRVFVLSEGPLSKPSLSKPYPELVGPGSMAVLDAATGRLVRITRVGINPVQVVLDTTAGRLYALSQQPYEPGQLEPAQAGSVAVLDAATGRLVRTTEVGINAVALAVDERHKRVFALAREPQGSDDFSSGTTSVLDAATGTLLRTLSDVGGTALAVNARTGRLFVASARPCPPAPSLDEANPGCLDVVDATTGRQLATHPLSQTVGPRAMAIDDLAGRVVALLEGMRGGVSDAQYVSHAATFDATTGAPLRSVKISRDRSAYAFALSVTAGRAVVVVGPDGYDIQMGNSGSARTSVVETRSGRVLSTAGGAVGPYGLDADVVIDARAGRIVALTQPLSDAHSSPGGPATVMVLDARTGRLLHTTPGQVGDVALGLDAARGHLFVANARSNTVRMLAVARL